MGKRVQHLLDVINRHDFAKLAKAAKHPREKIRFLGFVHLKEEKAVIEVADILKVSRNAIYQWLSKFEKEGLKRLFEKRGRGRKLLIEETEREAFKKSVLELQEQRTGGVINGQDVLKMMEERFGVKCTVRSVYNHLKKAKLVWISSRSKHPKANEETQLSFKKTSEKKF